MRWMSWLVAVGGLACLTACGKQDAAVAPATPASHKAAESKSATTNRQKSSDPAAESTNKAEPTPDSEADAVDDLPLPPDLGTRKQGADWATFLGPGRNGQSTETGLNLKWPVEGPPLVWTQPLGEGYGSPAISRGRLFMFQQFNDRATLRAMRAETGEKLWEFDYPSDFEDLLGYSKGPRCQPMIDGPRVYLYGSEGMLHCLQAADGKVLWKHDCNAEFKVVNNFFGVGSTPWIEGDLLIVCVGGSPEKAFDNVYAAQGRVPPNGEAIVAFDKRTGEIRYKLGDELAGYSSPIAAEINGKRWAFLLARGGLLAFDPLRGKERFHFPWRDTKLESVNASTPVVVGNQVLITETYGIGAACLEIKKDDTFEVVWSDTPPDEVQRQLGLHDIKNGPIRRPRRARDEKSLMTHFSTPIHIAGHLYSDSGRNTPDANLRCVELATGKVTWSANTIQLGDQEAPITHISLLHVDGHLLGMTEYGMLLVIKPNPDKLEVVSASLPREKGGVLSLGPRPLLRYPCWEAPVVSHGLLYVRGAGLLACFDVTAPAAEPAAK